MALLDRISEKLEWTNKILKDFIWMFISISTYLRNCLSLMLISNHKLNGRAIW